jgi:UDP-N-acetyl-D-mannosaminuronic acid dehydrogenase
LACPLRQLSAGKGFSVLGVDINEEIVDIINKGEVHISEPGIDELVKKVVTDGKLRAASTPEVSDVYLIVVPTPFKGNHEPDISFVEAATMAIIPLLKENDLCIIESTSPVGTTDKMASLIFSHTTRT